MKSIQSCPTPSSPDPPSLIERRRRRHHLIGIWSILLVVFIALVDFGVVRLFHESEESQLLIVLEGGVRKKKVSLKIETISLIGERNSGTNWMLDELIECFNNSFEVTRGLVRDKHWFQYEDSQNRPPTLVVAMFRNPYDWVAAMEHRPHHSPKHMFLDWYNFVTTPWTMPRPEADLQFNYTPNERNCQSNYSYDEVISCLKYPYANRVLKWSEKNPVYELRHDGSGMAYESILELRRDKIQNFLNTSRYDFVKNFISVQYETALKQGTDSLIQRIEEWTGVSADCIPTGPQNRRVRDLEEEFVNWLDEYIDWDMEALIGYKKGLNVSRAGV